jgi:DNA-binding PucR family transcriptional regulator
VAAECPVPGQEALPEIEERLRRHDVASAWRLDAELQEGLVSLRPRFDVERLCAELEPMASGRIGVSEPYPSLDQAPLALRQAQLAGAAATPGTTKLVRFDDEPIAVLLVSAPDASLSVARRILGRVLDLPDGDRILLIDTMRIWLAEAGSTSAAASRLHVHRNTVRYRLRRLEELTGRRLTDPLDVSELHVALECARMLGLG